MTGNRPWPQDEDGNDIDAAKQLAEFSVRRPIAGREGRIGAESRTCAWSDNCDWFAWSCGHKTVKVVPWDRLKNCSAEGLGSNQRGEAISINTGDLVWSLALGCKPVIDPPANQSAATTDRSVTGLCRHLAPGEVVLATGQQNGRIRVWDIHTGQLKFELCDHAAQIVALNFAPDGSMRLASASRDGSIKLWDLEDGGNLVRTLRSPSWGPPSVLNDCCWAPNAQALASVGEFKSVCIWDMKKLEFVRRLEGHHHTVCRCQFSPDGAILATSSFDTRVILWDIHRGVVLAELQHCRPPPPLMYAGGANGAYVRSLAFSPDGLSIATVCDDGFLRFWEIAAPDCPVSVGRVRGSLVCNYSPNGAVLAVGTSKGLVSLWQAPPQVTPPLLQHLCRLVVRRCLPSSLGVDSLKQIPPALRHFLAYRRQWWNYCEV